MTQAVACGRCASQAQEGQGMRMHVAVAHPENYPWYIDVLTGERVKEVSMNCTIGRPIAKMSKVELVTHMEDWHEDVGRNATVAELRKLHTVMVRQSDGEDDCATADLAEAPEPMNGSAEDPIPDELLAMGITNVGPEGRRRDNIACAMAVLVEDKSPEEAHRLKNLSHLSSAAIRYRASRTQVASGLRDCRCKDEGCGFSHANR